MVMLVYQRVNEHREHTVDVEHAYHIIPLDLRESTNHLNENGETSDGWDASDYLSMVNNSSLVQMIWDRHRKKVSQVTSSMVKFLWHSFKELVQDRVTLIATTNFFHDSNSGRAASSNWRRVWAEWGPGCVSECDVLLSHHGDMVPSGKLT